MAVAKSAVRSFELVICNVKNNEISQLPKEFKKAIQTSGKYYPKAVFTTAKMEKVYGAHGKPDLTREADKVLRKMKSALAKDARALRDSGYVVGTSTSDPTETSEDTPVTETTSDDEFRKWTSASGSTVEAKLLDCDALEAIFLTKAGKRIVVPRAKLSAESWARAQELK